MDGAYSCPIDLEFGSILPAVTAKERGVKFILHECFCQRCREHKDSFPCPLFTFHKLMDGAYSCPIDLQFGNILPAVTAFA